MILGMSIATFTLAQVILSLAGILAGLVAVYAMFGSKIAGNWTAISLVATILTSVTGFFFPRDHILPSRIVGVISLLLLAVACFALYSRNLAGRWRWVHAGTAIAALYLNVFVLVAQGFLKVPTLKALAPTGSEPPFAIAEGIVLLLFIAIGVFAIKAFHPQSGGAASPAVGAG